jgi:hypothetical protein
MIRRAIVTCLALTLSACAETGTHGGPLYAPAPPRAQPPPPPPPAAIAGHGTFRLKSGARGTCVGLSVVLMRDTPGFHQRMVSLYGSGERANLPIAVVKARSAKLGPASENPLVDTVQCDAQGFSFRGLNAGSYFVITRARVGAEDDVVMRRVELVPGETLDVSLAPGG